MARNRTNFTRATQARILALMGAGGTAESIAAQLTNEGVEGASRATVGRRMRELRGLEKKEAPLTPAPSSPAPNDVPLPESEDDIPPGTAVETFDVWLARAEKMANGAELTNNLEDLGKAGRLVTMLLEAKRKATPPAKPDPNENPDMIEMAKRVGAELHLLIDKVAP